MLGCASLLLALAAPPPLAERSFELGERSEVVATVSASCRGCDWGRKGHEAAALELRVDGRYSQHLFLARGEASAPYRVSVGSLPPGPHRLAVTLDPRRSAHRAREVSVDGLAIAAHAAGTPEALRLAHAPILEARPGSVERFSDLPLLAWVEEEPLANGGRRLRYSVVFSNEDGGTPPDRLMATWGRLTDLEYVYGARLDAAGHFAAGEYQGPDHRLLPFAGRREDDHPVLYVTTKNNMLRDRGRATVRLRPAPALFDLSGTSREAVMDAEPWSYAVSAGEARREGRVDARARPGSKRVPDPRCFATVEACAETRDATVAFSVAVRSDDGTTRWFDSDAGLPAFRIGRRATEFPNGCFRGAVALPPGTSAGRVTALRFRSFTRRAREGEPRLPAGSGRARLTSVNRLFLLGPDDQPAPSLHSWRGDLELPADGPAVELPLPGAPSR
jgi:hypothetical protein